MKKGHPHQIQQNINTMSRSISVQEVQKHATLEDLWLVVDGTVYDLTDFASEHPGGSESM